jgi:hypothetical protein
MDGDGTTIDEYAALEYSVLGLDALLKNTEHKYELSGAWTVFRRSKRNVSLEDQRSLLQKICKLDVHYNGVMHVLTNCNRDNSSWAEISNSSNVPFLMR